VLQGTPQLRKHPAFNNPNLEIILFCQHNSTGGGNLELKQTLHKYYLYKG
jgi:hypothetical protein